VVRLDLVGRWGGVGLLSSEVRRMVEARVFGKVLVGRD
jgi:hypothetical protein